MYDFQMPILRLIRKSWQYEWLGKYKIIKNDMRLWTTNAHVHNFANISKPDYSSYRNIEAKYLMSNYHNLTKTCACLLFN